MNKFLSHLKTVRTHRKWVRYYCFKSKLYWQGLTHDLSKYNPIEFFESVKYYQGNRSPIDACKEEKGYSNAWLHHRGRNKHHREYWVDYFDNGTACLPVPKKYAKEMICDFLGAGRAYGGKDFKFLDEWRWWQNQLYKNICIHPMTAYFITDVLYNLVHCANENDIFKNLDKFYTSAETWWNENNHLYSRTYFGRSLNFDKKIIHKVIDSTYK